jgi:ribosomal protein L7/L12
MGDTMTWALLGVLLALAAVNQNKLHQLERAIDGLRRRLDDIAAHLHVTASVTVPPEIAGLLQAGRKIEAIKVYRAATGAGLAEAKEAVERMQSEIAAPSKRIIQP